MVLAAFAALWRSIREARGWLTLVVVAGVGAWLYVQLAETRVDRDRLLASAEVICAGAGEPFAASVEQAKDTRGKRVLLDRPRGQLCAKRVAALVAFRADTERTTAEALAAAMREREGKAALDAHAAREAAEALASATHRMEIADAEAERRNRLDRDWWAAFNDLAGLRSPND